MTGSCANACCRGKLVSEHKTACEILRPNRGLWPHRGLGSSPWTVRAEPWTLVRGQGGPCLEPWTPKRAVFGHEEPPEMDLNPRHVDFLWVAKFGPILDEFSVDFRSAARSTFLAPFFSPVDFLRSGRGGCDVWGYHPAVDFRCHRGL